MPLKGRLILRGSEQISHASSPVSYQRVELLTGGATCLLVFLPDQATKCKAFSSNNTSPDMHRWEDRIDPCLPYFLYPPHPSLPRSLSCLSLSTPFFLSSLLSLSPSVALPLSLSLWGVHACYGVIKTSLCMSLFRSLLFLISFSISPHRILLCDGVCVFMHVGVN